MIIDKSSDGQDNYCCIKITSISDVKNLGSSASDKGNSVVSFKSEFDENTIRNREADAIARAEIIQKRYGINVTKEAQYLFDQLSKTYVFIFPFFYFYQSKAQQIHINIMETR